MALNSDTVDIGSNVACKSGIPGTDSSDLSSLQVKNKSKKEIDPEVLDLNDAEMIDRALGIYYKRMNRDDYYSSNNDGLFLRYFKDHDYDINEIVDELSGFPDDKNNINAAKNCCYLEFPMFDNFPMNKEYLNVNKQRMDQFDILQYCWQFGVPPMISLYQPKVILLINGYFRQFMQYNNNNNTDNNLFLTKIIEQEILLFLPEIEINWQKNIIFRERIRKILDYYSNWELMDKISCIIPNFLWLGDEDCALDIDTLKSNGIYNIINCAGFDVVGIEYPKEFKVHILYADDADEYQIIRDDISSCIQFIQQVINNNGRLLIHCLAGMNRSACITIACLMYFKGMDLLFAIKWTQTRRGWILSNESFQRQLIQYAAKLDLLYL